jgi:endonuclease/exonuclease/phosphatase family metal-dependent hydrolase
VKIMTINARQNRVLGLQRFRDMYELSWATRRRPAAFNGGAGGAVTAPDVIALQEVRTSNAEIVVHLMRQRFKTRFQIVGPEDAASQLVYNPETVTPQGDVVTWQDVCSDNTPGRREHRSYQFARFTENLTGTPFVVAAIHIPKNFVGTGQVDCYSANITELRNQLAAEVEPIFIAGDFNRRPVQEHHQCDPNEQSAELRWQHKLTQPSDGGRPYLDAVRTYHRRRGISLATQWTHERKVTSGACKKESHFRRNRIDYIFSAGAVVAEASTDHPGWAGRRPGTHHPTNHRYSDHRYVWGRFILDDVGRPRPPDLDHGTRGVITVSWDPVEGADNYIVYRALTGNRYSFLKNVDAPTTTFIDTATEHGRTYKYSIAARAANRTQGLESRRSWVTIDARGPHIVRVEPADGATGVDRRANIRIVFDERVDADSVRDDRIRLYRGTTRLSGKVRQVAPRVLVFDPSFPLWKGKFHRVVTKPVKDRYGNLGGSRKFGFTVKKRK